MRGTAPGAPLERRIFLIRGHRVMLDSDLADLYGVSPKVLNQAVKRRRNRFPADFMFQLNDREAAALRSQIVTLEMGRGRYSKYLPHAFTEQGVAMLSGVLNSERAVLVNIAIMRAFVKLREMASAHKELAAKLSELERRVLSHDAHIRSLFDAIRELLEPPESPKPPIGFKPRS